MSKLFLLARPVRDGGRHVGHISRTLVHALALVVVLFRINIALLLIGLSITSFHKLIASLRRSRHPFESLKRNWDFKSETCNQTIIRLFVRQKLRNCSSDKSLGTEMLPRM